MFYAINCSCCHFHTPCSVIHPSPLWPCLCPFPYRPVWCTKLQGKGTFTSSIRSSLVARMTCCVSVHRAVVLLCYLCAASQLLVSFQISEMLHLKRDYSVYHYLNHSGCTHANTIDDRKEFLATLVRGGVEGRGKGKGLSVSLSLVASHGSSGV